MLNSIAIFDLGSLVFNYSFKGSLVEVSKMACFNPRNAVLFYDSSNKIVSAIIICFECMRLKTYPEDFSTGDECSNKLDLYRAFFVKQGIKYGTKEWRLT